MAFIRGRSPQEDKWNAVERVPTGFGRIAPAIVPRPHGRGYGAHNFKSTGRLIRAVALCSLLALAISARSEDGYVVANWQIEQGLPQNSIRTMLQTRDGYLWLGTWNGLVRFDGIKFATFNLANTPAMRSEEITALAEDPEGGLWIGTDLGLLLFEKGRVTAPPEARGFRDARVNAIRTSPDGTLFVASNQGLFRQIDGQFIEIAVPNPDWPTRRCLLALAPSGDLWISHNSDLYAWKEGTLQRWATLPAAITAMSLDRLGTPWCILRDGKLVTFAEGAMQERDIPQGIAKENIYHALNGDLWICTDHGAFRSRENELIRISMEDGLPSNSISLAYEDAVGNTWLGTSDRGLVRLREKLLTTYGPKDGLSSDDAITVLEDRDGRVWLGTFHGGLNVFENRKWRPASPPGLPAPGLNVVSLCQTRDGSLLIGTYSLGPYRLRAGQARIEPVSKAFQDSAIRAILEDREGGLWFGSHSTGLEHLKNGAIGRYDTAHGLSNNSITAIAQDGTGDIWAGTQEGLNRIRDGQITRFFKEDGLGSNLVNALFVDESGTLWIGTMGGGLCRYKDARFTRVTTAQGLARDEVTQIVEDDWGHLWMGSRRGIFQANKDRVNAVMEGKSPALYCVSYTKADGLLNLSCVPGFQPSSMKARDGRLWFCGPGGVVVIDPKRMGQDKKPAPVFIENMLVDGESLLGSGQAVQHLDSRAMGSIGGTETSDKMTWVVAPGARRIEIQYTGLDFSTPEQLQFRYRLEGYDDEWQEAGTRRAAFYTRVPPGDYRFRVTSATGDPDHETPEAALDLIVLAHFRQTWWFRTLLISSGAIALLCLYRLRVRHLREVERLRWRIASDLHDEVGSNLSNIALLAQLAESSPTTPPAQRTEFTEISRVAVSTANAVRDLVWFISPECDTLEELVQQMETVAGRTVPSVAVEFDAKIESRARRLSLPFRRHVFFFFKEALHNALKHSNAAWIHVRVQEKSGVLELEVSDSGIGYDAAHVKQGQGLKTMRRRADDLGATLSMDCPPGAGTRIRLQARLS